MMYRYISSLHRLRSCMCYPYYYNNMIIFRCVVVGMSVYVACLDMCINYICLHAFPYLSVLVCVFREFCPTRRTRRFSKLTSPNGASFSHNATTSQSRSVSSKLHLPVKVITRRYRTRKTRARKASYERYGSHHGHYR